MTTSHRPAIVHCETMQDVRAHIDALDTQIVALLSQRSGYVAQAARIKQSEDRIVDVDRIEAIIARVRDLAQAQGGPPDVAEGTYRAMIDAFITFERAEFARQHKGGLT